MLHVIQLPPNQKVAVPYHLGKVVSARIRPLISSVRWSEVITPWSNNANGEAQEIIGCIESPQSDKGKISIQLNQSEIRPQPINRSAKTTLYWTCGSDFDFVIVCLLACLFVCLFVCLLQLQSKKMPNFLKVSFVCNEC
jgi:hypothetical protein